MSDTETVTVRANAEILDAWERDSVHTVARTKFVDAMIREGYVTEVDADPDAEPEPIGAAAEADLTVQAVQHGKLAAHAIHNDLNALKVEAA